MENKIIAKGRAASPGITAGLARIVTSIEELSKVVPGDILVVKKSNPVWTIGMMTASALISETGGVISHIAIIAREMGIPCITAVENITSILKNGQRIRIDGDKGVIYEH